MNAQPFAFIELKDLRTFTFMKTFMNVECPIDSSVSGWIRYDQMKQDVKSLEAGSIKMVAKAIQLIAERQKLVSLVVLLPGRYGDDMWDVKNDKVYFAEETFSEDIVGGHGEVMDA
ncbi:hypothetical protein B0A49_08382 [Cryomyces minteri]|uniref:Uncharacterized protein n=1 Tax=Cryomyces minteri TaxID=331657 RepID=A0A4U0XI17_9PEZI|nr:hypothetical protein B0A49_08382 [Cryomyces minteri]